MLEYYLLEDRSGRCRGSQHMAMASVLPSQDDENTFTINFNSGEHYKVSSISRPPLTGVCPGESRQCPGEAGLGGQAEALCLPPVQGGGRGGRRGHGQD